MITEKDLDFLPADERATYVKMINEGIEISSNAMANHGDWSIPAPNEEFISVFSDCLLTKHNESADKP